MNHFYPRPPCGGRPRTPQRGSRSETFLSTSPLRGTTTLGSSFTKGVTGFLSTSPLRGTTVDVRHVLHHLHAISIHVPLAGDDRKSKAQAKHHCISIHVPLAGDDRSPALHTAPGGYFYPRPPCGGRLFHPPPCGRGRYFYPRPPCGGRLFYPITPVFKNRFLSTSPLRGTTKTAAQTAQEAAISIHVPLAGDDTQTFTLNFVHYEFLSTSPLRGTTANVTENTVYFPAHLSQQDTAYKNTLHFCAVCGHFRGASAQSALKMLCFPVRTARRFSAR